jgi:hypothetical protein
MSITPEMAAAAVLPRAPASRGAGSKTALKYKRETPHAASRASWSFATAGGKNAYVAATQDGHFWP